MGRYCTKIVVAIVFFIDGFTQWHVIPKAKPWVRYAGKMPKPDNFKDLKNRPVKWAKMKKAKK